MSSVARYEAMNFIKQQFCPMQKETGLMVELKKSCMRLQTCSFSQLNTDDRVLCCVVMIALFGLALLREVSEFSVLKIFLYIKYSTETRRPTHLVGPDWVTVHCGI